jgi:hypothetical protein
VSAEFKSLAEVLREARAAAASPPVPAISPLIAQPPAEEPADRLFAARFAERLEVALQRLLEEIAAEVVGRELLLAPVDAAAIVERLLRRYGGTTEAPEARDGDIRIGDVDASLGRRVRAAIDRALA